MKRPAIAVAVIYAALLWAALIHAGERLNGIYLGSDVARTDHKLDIAVEINEAGLVTVYMGALVPNIKDRNGKEVRVRSVRVVKD